MKGKDLNAEYQLAVFYDKENTNTCFLQGSIGTYQILFFSSFRCALYDFIPVYMFDNQILMHEPIQLLFYSRIDGSGYAGSFPELYVPTLNIYI